MNNPRPFSKAWLLIKIIAPTIWFVITAALGSMLATIITMWREIPVSMDFIATEWQGRALRNGWPSRYDRQTYWFFYMVAGFMSVVGWILCSYLTIFILRLIF